MRRALLILLVGCTHPPLPPVLSEDACGIGTWGALIVDDDTIFVRADADPNGDGSEARPFDTMQAGADAAGARGGGLVAVAEGVYAEQVTLEQDHDGVHIAGRCSDRVVIDASGFVEGDAGDQFAIKSNKAQITLSGLTLLGAAIGLYTNSGEVSISSSAIKESKYTGIYGGSSMDGSAPIVRAADVSLLDAAPQDVAGAYFGFGALIRDGATFEASNLLVDDNVRMGVYGYNATITLTDSAITNTRAAEHGEFPDKHPTPSDNQGVGLFVVGESGEMSLTVTRTLIQGNTQAGIYLNHTNASLTDVEIRDTQMNMSHASAGGLLITEGSAVTATGLIIENNAWAGIATSLGKEGTDSGPSTLILTDSEVRRTQPGPRGESGTGLALFSANVQANGLIVDENHWFGLCTMDTTVELINTQISNTQAISLENVDLSVFNYILTQEQQDELSLVDTPMAAIEIGLLSSTLIADELLISQFNDIGVFGIDSIFDLSNCLIRNETSSTDVFESALTLLRSTRAGSPLKGSPVQG